MHERTKEMCAKAVAKAVECHIMFGSEYFEAFKAPIFFQATKIFVDLLLKGTGYELSITALPDEKDADLIEALPLAQALLLEKLNSSR